MSYIPPLIICFGAFAGGFVSGLAGFGTGLVALGIWLHALPPATASRLDQPMVGTYAKHRRVQFPGEFP